MRNPNGYGSVVYLGKGRRKPYAVRVPNGYKDDTETNKSTIKYRYIDYFEKSKDAAICLAKYNSGMEIKEHKSLTEQPTFDQVYKSWLEHKLSLNNRPGESTVRNYNIAFDWCHDLHGKRFSAIRLDDIQSVVNQYKDKSKSTVMIIKTVLNQMYQFAMKRDIVDKNYSLLADYEWVESEDKAHAPFTDEEIKLLWDNVEYEDVDLILMMIYTGFRASEFIMLENRNVHIKERYVIGGMKTDAGKDRTVALNNKIIPLFEKRNNKKRYLIHNSKETKYSYGVFYIDVWSRIMKQFNMDHSPHDTRHTFASLLDRAGANKVCIKKLMGHSIQDITDGVYTHKTLEDLLEAVNLI